MQMLAASLIVYQIVADAFWRLADGYRMCVAELGSRNSTFIIWSFIQFNSMHLYVSYLTSGLWSLTSEIGILNAC